MKIETMEILGKCGKVKWTVSDAEYTIEIPCDIEHAVGIKICPNKSYLYFYYCISRCTSEIFFNSFLCFTFLILTNAFLLTSSVSLMAFTVKLCHCRVPSNTTTRTVTNCPISITLC